MGRQAAVKTGSARASALDARLKALFEAVEAEPVPERLLRHLDGLAPQRVNGVAAPVPKKR